MKVQELVEKLADVPLNAEVDVRLPLIAFGKYADDYPVRNIQKLDCRSGDGDFYFTLII
jgi:hypothetical protein